MSQLLIQQYLNQLATLKKVSGSQRESVIREAFKDLLKGWAKSHDLVFIPEYEIETKTKERRYVDGALLYELRMPFGYWEAKDEKDDLEAEIEAKFKRGYPQDNIIFEDSKSAILIQDREEVMRALVDDQKSLEKLLNLFFGYERKEISEFRKAVDQFKTDLPAVLEGLREMIEAAHKENAGFRKAAAAFLEHARETINPTLGDADVREMLIQHILTEEIFAAVFPQAPFHKDNNVARELYKLEATFFTGNTKFKTLKGLEPYYASIRSAAAQINSHHEKQTFLKVIYENFYKVYNKKAADRLGVVYTPNEIVRFMIESADWLCEKHFGRNLIDKDVEILDPATGTGTFVCELLEHFRGQPAKLKHKYKRELHANEVAILPYYVANLNIEATYAAITGEYEEYPNLCFVDTLDNVAGLRKHAGHIDDMFGAVSDINIKRIREQNNRRISVIIGNPPYNANQLNENENNENREYPEIDKRIKETYVAASTAQKTKLYDMYARFFRWAADRLDENGILAFISNRSFISSRTFDGFRGIVAKEFYEIRTIDLGGDVRANPKLSGTTHNVFGIQTGVAISFMVRKSKNKHSRIFYARRPEEETAEEKLSFLANSHIKNIAFEEIEPDRNRNWLNLTDNDFDQLLEIGNDGTKATADEVHKGNAIFKTFSNGIVTARDEWMCDFSNKTLTKKVQRFIETYSSEQERWFKSATSRAVKNVPERKTALRNFVSREIKWTEELEAHLDRPTKLAFDSQHIRASLYRPFVKMLTYYAKALTHRTYQQDRLFPIDGAWNNRAICFVSGNRLDFAVIATDCLPNYAIYSLDPAQCLARFRYGTNGQKSDNLTEWAIKKFRERYETGGKNVQSVINYDSIFSYVYAVLHDPIYRKKYAINLKRDFPRIPFYENFQQWANWGKTLMELHVGYERAAPAKLKRTDIPDEKVRTAGQAPKAMLKADKDGGRIVVDSETTLSGVPPEAWEYRLGNRSALEWILDQYKESKPKDPTIREKFDTYRFKDYKEKVIDLLARVATVSVETQRIVEAMKKAAR